MKKPIYKKVRYDEDWLVICELCWGSYNKLGCHIRLKHNILTRDYRKMFWLDNNARLMSKASIELARKRNRENYDKVVVQNLIKKGVNTRYYIWHEWRFREKCSPQTMARLSQQSFIKLSK